MLTTELSPCFGLKFVNCIKKLCDNILQAVDKFVLISYHNVSLFFFLR